MIALIKLTCVVTQWGEHVLICLSDIHGEKMSSQLQSGGAGLNWKGLAVTGQSASIVELGSAFFLCQTVFWHRPYPHIQPLENGHAVWHSLKVLQRGEKEACAHVSPIPKLLTPTPYFFSSFLRCDTKFGELAAVLEDIFTPLSQVEAAVPQNKNTLLHVCALQV